MNLLHCIILLRNTVTKISSIIRLYNHHLRLLKGTYVFVHQSTTCVPGKPVLFPKENHSILNHIGLV